MSAMVEDGRHVIATRQIKIVDGLTCDIKCETVKRLFHSAAEITEEVRINVSQFISPLQLSGNSFS